jgi:hypothetical protein
VGELPRHRRCRRYSARRPERLAQRNLVGVLEVGAHRQAKIALRRLSYWTACSKTGR